MRVTDTEVREAIADVIKTAQPDAIVFNWNVLGHNMADWPGLFRVDDAVTHGWLIKRNGTQSEWKNAYRDRQFWIYDIWGFFGFRAGKEGDNSDEDFAEITDSIYAGFKAEGKLGLEEVEEHELLQFNLITTIDCGEETLHFAQGRLRVRLCC